MKLYFKDELQTLRGTPVLLCGKKKAGVDPLPFT